MVFYFAGYLYCACPFFLEFFHGQKTLPPPCLDILLIPLKKLQVDLWNYLPNLLPIIVIVFVFRYILKGIHFLKNEIQKGNLHITGFYPDWANPTYQIVRVLIFAFMFIVIFPYLPGSDSARFSGSICVSWVSVYVWFCRFFIQCHCGFGAYLYASV